MWWCLYSKSDKVNKVLPIDVDGGVYIGAAGTERNNEDSMRDILVDFQFAKIVFNPI